MNQTGKIVIAVIAVLVVLYGGYRLAKHFQRLNNAPTQQTTVTITPPPSGTITETTAPAAGNSVYKTMSNTAVGSYFADPKGMTLYTYAKDGANTSTCTGQCLVIWPAYKAPSRTGNFPANVGVITRTDGTLQYTYKEMPLYFYVNDKAAGDVTGQGVGGIWFVAK